MGMHAVIPVLFVVVVEASRHAVGRIAAITADRHMESVRLLRWVLSPVPTFRLWRRMKLWELRSYDEVVRLEQDRLVYRAQLRFRYGRGWRRAAPIQALLPLKLAKYGKPLDLGVLERIEAEAREAEEARASRRVVEAAPVPVPQAAIPAVAASAPEAVAAAVSAEPASAVPPVSAELAVPTLAKLAAVRLRDAQEPEQSPAPAQARDELNVWTERAVRTHAPQGAMDATGRVPGQASPWFKPPRPAEQAGPDVRVAAPAQRRQPPAYAGPAPAAAQPREQEPREREPQLREAGEREPLPRDAGLQSDRLDPELCFEALVSYIDTYDSHPDPQRLAEYLTAEYEVVGNRPDGSVSPSQLAKIWPALQERYVSAGRD